MQCSPWSLEAPSLGALSPTTLWASNGHAQSHAVSTGGPGNRAEVFPTTQRSDVYPVDHIQDTLSPRLDSLRTAFVANERPSLAEKAQNLTRRLFPTSPHSLNSSASSQQLAQDTERAAPRAASPLDEFRQRRARALDLSKQGDLPTSPAPAEHKTSPSQRVFWDLPHQQDNKRVTPRAVSPVEVIRSIRAQPDLRLPDGKPPNVIVVNRDEIQGLKEEVQAAGVRSDIQNLKEEVHVLTYENKQAKESQETICRTLQSRVRQLEVELAKVETDWQQRCVNAECKMEDELKSWGSLPVSFAMLHEKVKSQRAEDSVHLRLCEEKVEDQQQVIHAHEKDILALRSKLQSTQLLMNSRTTESSRNVCMISSLQKKVEEANKMVLELEGQLQDASEQEAFHVSKHNTCLLQTAALEEELDNSRAEARSLKLLEHRLSFQLEHQIAESESAKLGTEQDWPAQALVELSEKSIELERFRQECAAMSKTAIDCENEPGNCGLRLELDQARDTLRKAEVRSRLEENQTIAELQSENHLQRSELNAIPVEQSASKHKLQFALLDQERTQRANEELQAEVQRLERELRSAELQLTFVTEREDSFKQANAELQHECRCLKSNLDSAQLKLGHGTEQGLSHVAANAESQNKKDELEPSSSGHVQLEATVQQLECLQQRNAKIQAESHRFQAELSDAKLKSNNLVEQEKLLLRVNGELNADKQKLESMMKANAELHERVAQLVEQLNSMQEQRDAAERIVKGMKANNSVEEQLRERLLQAEAQGMENIVTVEKLSRKVERLELVIADTPTTQLAREVVAGSTVLWVSSTVGFAAGNSILLQSSAGAEINVITDQSSMRLKQALKYTHPAGSKIKKLRPDDPLLQAEARAVELDGTVEKMAKKIKELELAVVQGVNNSAVPRPCLEVSNTTEDKDCRHASSKRSPKVACRALQQGLKTGKVAQILQDMETNKGQEAVEVLETTSLRERFIANLAGKRVLHVKGFDSGLKPSQGLSTKAEQVQEGIDAIIHFNPDFLVVDGDAWGNGFQHYVKESIDLRRKVGGRLPRLIWVKCISITTDGRPANVEEERKRLNQANQWAEQGIPVIVFWIDHDLISLEMDSVFGSDTSRRLELEKANTRGIIRILCDQHAAWVSGADGMLLEAIQALEHPSRHHQQFLEKCSFEDAAKGIVIFDAIDAPCCAAHGVVSFGGGESVLLEFATFFLNSTSTIDKNQVAIYPHSRGREEIDPSLPRHVGLAFASDELARSHDNASLDEDKRQCSATFMSLMKAQGEKQSPWILIEEANSMLRGGVHPARKYHSIQDVAKRGITLKQLMNLATYVEETLRVSEIIDDDTNSAEHGQRLVWRVANMYSVCRNFIMPLTQRAHCSYSEWVAREDQVPMWFISHWWGTPLVATLEMLSHHANSRHPEKHVDTIYWMCTIANNQHDLSNISNPDLLESPFAKALLNLDCFGTVLLCDPKVTPLTRIWCILEAHLTERLRRRALHKEKLVHFLDVATVVTSSATEQAKGTSESSGEMTVSMMQDVLRGNWRETSEPPGQPFPLEVARVACQIDVVKAHASVPKDAQAILNFIANKGSVDQEPPLEHPEFGKLNQFVHSIFLSCELYRSLTEENSWDRVRDLLKLQADPNKTVRHGQPAFFGLAISREDNSEKLEITKLLIASRARVNQVDAHNKTVMDYSNLLPADVQTLLQREGATTFEKLSSEQVAQLEDEVNHELAEIGDFFSDTFGSFGGGGDGAKLMPAAQRKLHIMAAVLNRFPRATCHIQLRDTKPKLKQGENVRKELAAAGCNHQFSYHYLPHGEGPVLQVSMSFKKKPAGTPQHHKASFMS